MLRLIWFNPEALVTDIEFYTYRLSDEKWLGYVFAVHISSTSDVLYLENTIKLSFLKIQINADINNATNIGEKTPILHYSFHFFVC